MPQPQQPFDFLRDPRVQVFGKMLSDQVNQTMAGMITQLVQRLEQTLSPAGRVVKVVRHDDDGMEYEEQTTTPQLLAELNDNLIDFMELMDDQRPRSRKRRKKYD